MFKRLASSSSAAPAARTTAPVSIIGADMRIVGNIVSDGQVQIDGQLDGDIACQNLVVGDLGRINGEVTAAKVRYHGQLNGRITAEAVFIARSGRIAGDIVHSSLEIEAGAQIEGCLLRKEVLAPSPPAPHIEGSASLIDSAVPA